MKNINQVVFACIDCETTGLDPEVDKIIEIGLSLFTTTSLLGVFSATINNNVQILECSSQIHGIDNTITEISPSFTHVFELFHRFFEAFSPVAIIGHSINFDLAIITHNANQASCMYDWIHQVPTLDTLKLSKAYYPSQHSFSLKNLCKYFNVQIVPTHRVLDDILATKALFLHILKQENITNISQLFLTMNTPIIIKKMPFGKYKGINLNMLPENYLRYIYNTLTMDPDLTESIHNTLITKYGNTNPSI